MNIPALRAQARRACFSAQYTHEYLLWCLHSRHTRRQIQYIPVAVNLTRYLKVSFDVVIGAVSETPSRSACVVTQILFVCSHLTKSEAYGGLNIYNQEIYVSSSSSGSKVLLDFIWRWWSSVCETVHSSSKHKKIELTLKQFCKFSWRAFLGLNLTISAHNLVSSNWTVNCRSRNALHSQSCSIIPAKRQNER